MYLFSEINWIWRLGSWRWGQAEQDVNWCCLFLYCLLCCSASISANADLLLGNKNNRVWSACAHWMIDRVGAESIGSAVQYDAPDWHDDAAAANYQDWLPESSMKNLIQAHYQRQLPPHLLNIKHVSQGLFSFTSPVTDWDLILISKTYYLCDKACFYFFHFKCLSDCLK